MTKADVIEEYIEDTVKWRPGQLPHLRLLTSAFTYLQYVVPRKLHCNHRKYHRFSWLEGKPYRLENCPNCAGTGLQPIPWKEVMSK